MKESRKNKGQWIEDLLHGRIEDSPSDYFKVDGQPLRERNPKWINNDYVKFLRFAQYRIEKTGEGVVGFITSNSYLRGPIFRGMRESLLKCFEEIYVLDLHGNINRGETTPSGAPDESVFDNKEGTAICILIKSRESEQALARLHYAELWGKRSAADGTGKYEWLMENDLASTKWNELEPVTPKYHFVPRDRTHDAEFQRGWSIADIFPLNSVGVVTAKDKLAIQFSDGEMVRAMDVLVTEPIETVRRMFKVNAKVKTSSLMRARFDVEAFPDRQRHVLPIVHAPFDVRYTYYTGTTDGIAARPRREVMCNMVAGQNVGLVSSRLQADVGTWTNCGVTRHIARVRSFAKGSGGVSSLFPLYRYPSPVSDQNLDLGFDVTSRVPNLAPQFIHVLEQKMGIPFVADSGGEVYQSQADVFKPEDVLNYIYAVLHSAQYRNRYAELLDLEFPRVPVPSSHQLFADLGVLGDEVGRAPFDGKGCERAAEFPCRW